MEMLMKEVTPMLVSILVVILSTLSVYVTTKVKDFVDSKIDASNQEKLIDFVALTVDYVEQIGVEIDAYKKFDLAKSKVVDWLNAKGLPVNDSEIEVLIEAFVHKLTLYKDVNKIE